VCSARRPVVKVAETVTQAEGVNRFVTQTVLSLCYAIQHEDMRGVEVVLYTPLTLINLLGVLVTSPLDRKPESQTEIA
jgi:hypothetical protein